MGKVGVTTEQLTNSGQRGEHDTSAWNDYNVGVQSLSRGAITPDDEILIGNIKALAFDGGNRAEEVFGVLEILHGYKEGTDLRPHIHVATSSTDIGDIKIQLELSVANADGVYDTVVTGSAIITTNGIDRQHIAKEFDFVVDGTNLHIGAQMHFKLFRDPSDSEDTYPEDVFLSTVGAHAEIDGDGSRNVFTKE